MGGVIGWLACLAMKTDYQEEILLNVMVGIAGAWLAGWLISPLIGAGTIHQANFSVGSPGGVAPRRRNRACSGQFFSSKRRALTLPPRGLSRGTPAQRRRPEVRVLSRAKRQCRQCRAVRDQVWEYLPARGKAPHCRHTPPSAIPIESQRTTALLPSLTQLARISEPRIASDQTRGVCLLCAIVFHPLELVFGLHLGLGNGAVLACRGE